MPKKSTDYRYYEFPGRHSGEEVEALLRLHPIVMRKGLIGLSLAFCLLSIPYLIFPEKLSLLWLSLAGFILGLLLLAVGWIRWYYSLILVTNMRFLFLNQKGFFSNSVIEVGLEKIQNVNYQVDGLEQTLLGFGTINVQTFAGDLVVEHVHKPKEVQNAINKSILKHKETNA